MKSDIRPEEKAQIAEKLRQSEAFLAEAQRLSHTGSWALDVASDKYVYISEECRRIVGLDASEPSRARETVFRRVHPEDRDRVNRIFEKSLREKVDTSDENRMVLPDGTVKHIHVISHPVLDNSGRVVRLVGTLMDITERKRAEEHLALARFALDNAHDAVFFVDEQGRCLYANEEACRSLGATSEEVLTMGVPDIDPDFPKERWVEHWQTLKTKRSLNFESRHRAKDGRIFPVEISAKYLEYGGKAFNLSVVRDITERKKAEENLRASQEELRRLAGYLNRTREEERTAIARDLHDELGQQLSILTIDLASLENQLHEPDKALAAGLKEMSQRVDDAIRTVQRIATGLRPSLLDNLGLAAAIEWQAKDFTKRTRVPSDVTVPKEAVKLDRDLSTALFRIFQESLTNVGRHARASRVRIEFRQTQEGIIFEIADNGRGIRNAEANAASSLGLIGMRERLHPWKGSLEVVGREGQGTTVRVRVPLGEPS